METIKRTSDVYRPYKIYNNTIGRIVFHDGERDLLTIQSGFLQHRPQENKVYSNSNDVVSLDLPNIRNARKKDLSKKDCFVISYNDKDKSYWENGKALYIYTKPEFIETLKEKWEETTQICDVYKINIPCEIMEMVEREEYGPKGEKYQYQEIKHDSFVIHTNFRTEKTAFGEKVQNLAEKISSVLNRKSLDSFEVAKLLKHFKIEELSE